MDKMQNGLLMVNPSEETLHPAPPGACLDQIAKICEAFHLDALRPQINACTEALKDGDSVDVAVIGRFKAGKSSFLNSLIGRDLLPVAAVPLTAVVTRLRYGPRDRAVVMHLDGRAQDIPVERVAEYVTQQHNPDNVKAVAIVDVEVPNLEAYQGIRFVDTPGLGSVFAHNTQTAMDWLPKVGASLLAVSSDHPLSEQDVELLKELATHTPEVSILLTKADLVSPTDLVEITRFIRDHVGGLPQGAVRLFPFSTRPGYEEVRQTVQEYLLRQVSQRHAEKAREILQHKLRSLIAGCRAYLQMALSAAGAVAEARAQLQAQLQHERQSLAEVRNEIWIVATDLKSRLQSEALERYLGHGADLRARLLAELLAAVPHWRGHLGKTAEAFSRWMHDALHEQLSPLSYHEGEELTTRHLAAAQASVSRVVQAFQDRLGEGIEQALHTSFRGARFEATIRQPHQPDVRVSRVFDIPFELVWFLIPMGVFRQLVNRHFVRRLPWEVEKNLHRLAGQWSQAIAASIDGLARQAQDFIREELATVEGLVAEAEDRRPAIEQGLATLEGLATAVARTT